jgi:YggT family protein
LFEARFECHPSAWIEVGSVGALLLIARVVVEFIRSFSRDWHPRGVTVVVLEVIMTMTDPPVKLLRRIIPQLTIGSIRFDLSIMVLLLVAFIGMQLAFGAAA